MDRGANIDSPARADWLPILAVAELLAAAIVLAAHVLGKAEAWDANASKLQQADHWSEQWTSEKRPGGKLGPCSLKMLLSAAAKLHKSAQAGIECGLPLNNIQMLAICNS